jgi:ribosomal protein S18 acetylase RimI-like enzyme
MNIRAANMGDRAALLGLQIAAGMFTAEDIAPVADILDACLSGDKGPDHRSVVYGGDDGFRGAAYYAAEVVSDRVWNLLMIAVLPEAQGQGIGEQLISHIETELRSVDQRILIVETSSTDQFDKTRDFYVRLGFTEEGRIRHYYGDDEHKVIFAKALS